MAMTPEMPTQRPGKASFVLGTVIRALCIAALVVFFVMVFVTCVGYSDYVVRSQVSEGPSLADAVQRAVGEYLQAHGSLPRSNREAELPEPRAISGMYVSYVDIGKRPGRIEIGYSSLPPQKAHRSIDGKHLWFDASINDGALTWT